MNDTRCQDAAELKELRQQRERERKEKGREERNPEKEIGQDETE